MDFIFSETISVTSETETQEMDTEKSTEKAPEKIESLLLDATAEAPTTQITETETTEIVTEKVGPKEEQPEADTEKTVSEEPEADKILEVEIKVEKEAHDIDVESPTEEWVIVQGKSRKQKKRVTKVEKTITSIQTADAGLISLTPEVTAPELKAEAQASKVKDISPEAQVTLTIQEERAQVTTPENEISPLTISLKAKELEETTEGAQEISILASEVTITTAEQKELPSGFQLPSLKSLFFLTSEIKAESSVDEPTEFTPAAEAEVTVEKPIEPTITLKTGTEFYTTKEGMKDMVDTAETSAEISMSKSEVKALETETESHSWRFPTFSLPKISFFGMSEVKAEDDSQEISAESEPKVTAQQEITTVKTDTSESTESITKLEESVYITETRTKRLLAEGKEKIVGEETEASLKISLPSFQVPVLSKTEQTGIVFSQTISGTSDTEIQDKPAEEVPEKIETMHLDETTEAPTSQVPETETSEVGTQKIDTEEEKPEAAEEKLVTEESEADKALTHEIKEIVTKVVDGDKDLPTEEGVKTKGKSRKYKRKVTKVEKTITTILTADTGHISSTPEVTTLEFKDEAQDSDVKNFSPEAPFTFAIHEKRVQVTTSEDEMRPMEISIKAKEVQGTTEGVQETSTLVSEVTITTVKDSAEGISVGESAPVFHDMGEKSYIKEETAVFENDQVSASVSLSSFGASVISERVNITNKDAEVQIMPFSSHKEKTTRDGQLKKSFSTDKALGQQINSHLHGPDSASEKRGRIVSQLSLGLGVTVLQESISITDDGSPKEGMTFKDKIYRKYQDNLSPSKDFLTGVGGTSDISYLHTKIGTDIKGAEKDIERVFKKDQDIVKTIENINLKVQQLKVEDEEDAFPERGGSGAHSSILSFKNVICKEELSRDNEQKDVPISHHIADHALSSDELAFLNVSKVIQTKTSKDEHCSDDFTSISALPDTSNVLMPLTVTEPTRIHFTPFSPAQLGISVISQSIHIGDDKALKDEMDSSTLEANLQTEIPTKNEDIKSVGEIPESSGWKFQMPSLKMNIFSKTDKRSDSVIDSGSTGNAESEVILKDETEADDDKQTTSEDKPRSPFKLPTFKLPSFNLRGRKVKTSENIVVDSIRKETISEPNWVSSQEELPTDIPEDKDTRRLDGKAEESIKIGEKVKTSVFSIKGEHTKKKLPKLEFSKPTMKVSSDSTKVMTDSFNMNVSQETGTNNLKAEVSQDIIEQSSEAVFEMPELETGMSPVKLEDDSAEDINIEFPYFKAPVLVPQVDTSEARDSHDDLDKEICSSEIKKEEVMSTTKKTPLHKTKAINMSASSPDLDDSMFLSVKQDDISFSPQHEVSGTKSKQTRKVIKLSLPKVKIPAVTLSAPREKECFDIAASRDELGLDVPEYDISNKEEPLTVDISCVANQSVPDITEALESSDLVDEGRCQADYIADPQEETIESEKAKSILNTELQDSRALESAFLLKEGKVLETKTRKGIVLIQSPTATSRNEAKETHDTVKISHMNYIIFSAPSPEAPEKSNVELYSDNSSVETQSEYDNVSPDAIKTTTEKMKISSVSSNIVKEYEISSSEMPEYGFSLFKVKLPDSITKALETQTSDIQSKDRPMISEETATEMSQPPESTLDNSTDGFLRSELMVSSKVHLPKVKTFSIEMKSPTQTSTVSFPIHSKDETVKHLETAEDPSQNLQQEQMTIKQKETIQKSPSKFKFRLPIIGFSSVDETERKKAELEEQRHELFKSEKESSSSSKEKVPWYKFPKRGISSTEKQKSVEKEIVDKPEVVSTTAEAEHVETQVSSEVSEDRQASLAVPEDFMAEEKDLGDSSIKPTK